MFVCNASMRRVCIWCPQSPLPPFNTGKIGNSVTDIKAPLARDYERERRNSHTRKLRSRDCIAAAIQVFWLPSLVVLFVIRSECRHRNRVVLLLLYRSVSITVTVVLSSSKSVYLSLTYMFPFNQRTIIIIMMFVCCCMYCSVPRYRRACSSCQRGELCELYCISLAASGYAEEALWNTEGVNLFMKFYTVRFILFVDYTVCRRTSFRQLIINRPIATYSKGNRASSLVSGWLTARGCRASTIMSSETNGRQD
jgi:hypothetical protein